MSLIGNEPDFFHGLLAKRGKVNPAWKDRWCVLDLCGQVLRYYETQALKKECGNVDVSLVERIEVVSNYDQIKMNEVMRVPPFVVNNHIAKSNRQYTLQLVLSDRTYVFSAKTAQDFHSWIHHLWRAVFGGVILQGPLQKRGEINRGWKSRYFILTRYKRLKYYENNTRADFFGVIDLNKLSFITDESTEDKKVNGKKATDVQEEKHSLHLHTPNREWILMAANATEKETWYYAISNIAFNGKTAPVTNMNMGSSFGGGVFGSSMSAYGYGGMPKQPLINNNNNRDSFHEVGPGAKKKAKSQSFDASNSKKSKIKLSFTSMFSRKKKSGESGENKDDYAGSGPGSVPGALGSIQAQQPTMPSMVGLPGMGTSLAPNMQQQMMQFQARMQMAKMMQNPMLAMQNPMAMNNQMFGGFGGQQYPQMQQFNKSMNNLNAGAGKPNMNHQASVPSTSVSVQEQQQPQQMQMQQQQQFQKQFQLQQNVGQGVLNMNQQNIGVQNMGQQNMALNIVQPVDVNNNAVRPLVGNNIQAQSALANIMKKNQDVQLEYAAPSNNSGIKSSVENTDIFDSNYNAPVNTSSKSNLDFEKSGKLAKVFSRSQNNIKEWTNLFGIRETNDNLAQYHWRIRINRLNVELDSNSNNENENNSGDLLIGLMDAANVEKYKTMKIPFSTCELGYALDCNGILQANGIHVGQYCHPFSSGDIVDVYLDMKLGVIWFNKSGSKSLSISYQIQTSAYYKLGIAMYGDRHSVEILSFEVNSY